MQSEQKLFTYAQVTDAVKAVQKEDFGKVVVKIRHGKIAFIEKQITKQVKPQRTIRKT